MTNGNIQPQDSVFTKMMKELERKLCFTDVPCGAMEFKKEHSLTHQKTTTGWLESALCFSDLKDINGHLTPKDIERIQTMQSLGRIDTNKSLVDFETCADSTEDTDSCSDDSDESKMKREDRSFGVELRVKPEILNSVYQERALPADNSDDDETTPDEIVISEQEGQNREEVKEKRNDDNGSLGSASALTLPSIMGFTLSKKKSKRDIDDSGRRSLKTSIGNFTKRAMRSRASIPKEPKGMNDSKNSIALNLDTSESGGLSTTERASGSSRRWAMRKQNTLASF